MIERANLILGVAVTALGRCRLGRSGTLGAGVGALLACVDFVAIRPPRRVRADRRWPPGGDAAARAAWRAGLALAVVLLLQDDGAVRAGLARRSRVLTWPRSRSRSVSRCSSCRSCRWSGLRGRADADAEAGAQQRHRGHLMGPHATWFDFLPGYPALQENAAALPRPQLDLAGVPGHPLPARPHHGRAGRLPLPVVRGLRYAAAVNGRRRRRPGAAAEASACATCSRCWPTPCSA